MSVATPPRPPSLPPAPQPDPDALIKEARDRQRRRRRIVGLVLALLLAGGAFGYGIGTPRLGDRRRAFCNLHRLKCVPKLFLIQLRSDASASALTRVLRENHAQHATASRRRAAATTGS